MVLLFKSIFIEHTVSPAVRSKAPVEPPIVMNEPPKIDPYENLDNLLLSLLTN